MSSLANSRTYLLRSFTLGVLAGVRSMTAPATASLVAGTSPRAPSGRLRLLNEPATTVLLSALAIGEIFADKLPFMPDRKAPPSFAWRVISGGLSAAVVRARDESIPLAVIAGAIGAAAGTLGGSALRSRLAAVFQRDVPAALIEDTVVILLVALVLNNLSPRDNHDSTLA